MSDKIVNHFVLADGSTAKYDAGSLLNLDETVSLAGYAPDAKAVGDRLTDSSEELEDIRVGANGVTYASAGGAVRGQVSTKIEKPNYKSFIGTVTRGSYQRADGTIYNESYALTLTAEVEPSKTYIASGTAITQGIPLIVMFDENNAVIDVKENSGNLTPITNYEFKTPSNCTKVAINARAFDILGGCYPSLYSIEQTELDGVQLQTILNGKQSRAIKWEKATYEHETGKFVHVAGQRAAFANHADYNYAQLVYDREKQYRFYGACRASNIPVLICTDSNNEIIKVYDDAETVIQRKTYSDIPENTYYIYVNGFSSETARVEVATERNPVSLQTGKVGVFFGDSITQGNNVYKFGSIPYEDYPTVIGDLLSCETYNGGLGGSTYSDGRSIDFTNIVDCIVSGDFSTVYAGITQYGLDTSATLQYNAIEDLDFSEVDFVSIALGTNDWNFGQSVANIKTAMSYCIEKLMQNFPNLDIYVFTPINRFNINGSGEDADTYVNTTSGLKLIDVCEAIEETARKYNVPCKNMLYSCNINAYNKTLYMGDDTHPNANGYALIGEKVGKFINAN